VVSRGLIGDHFRSDADEVEAGPEAPDFAVAHGLRPAGVGEQLREALSKRGRQAEVPKEGWQVWSIMWRAHIAAPRGDGRAANVPPVSG
jgi:hypothetical protein